MATTTIRAYPHFLAPSPARAHRAGDLHADDHLLAALARDLRGDGGYRSGAPLGLGALRMHGEAIYQRDLEESRALGKEAVEEMQGPK